MEVVLEGGATVSRHSVKSSESIRRGSCWEMKVWRPAWLRRPLGGVGVRWRLLVIQNCIAD